MRHLKKYKIFEGVLSGDVREYINDIGLYLNDIGLYISYGDILCTVAKTDYGTEILGNLPVIRILPKVREENFTLDQIKDEVNHIISYLEHSGYRLKSVKYISTLKSKSIWKTMYDSSTVNRWGVPQPKDDIFDIQDMNLTKEKAKLFELIFFND
jgi:hypothetical protein